MTFRLFSLTVLTNATANKASVVGCQKGQMISLSPF